MVEAEAGRPDPTPTRSTFLVMARGPDDAASRAMAHFFGRWFGYGFGSALGGAVFGEEKRAPAAWVVRRGTEADFRADELRFAEDQKRLEEQAKQGR